MGGAGGEKGARGGSTDSDRPLSPKHSLEPGGIAACSVADALLGLSRGANLSNSLTNSSCVRVDYLGGEVTRHFVRGISNVRADMYA